MVNILNTQETGHRDTEAQRFSVSEKVIGCAIEVHRVLGPGLLESAYESALAYEMVSRNLRFQRQLDVPVTYKGHSLGHAYRLDFLVEEELLVELKAVDCLKDIHTAQLLTYLKITARRQGLLINFNMPALRQGIKRASL